MIKKFITVISIFSIMSLMACTESKEMYSISYFDYMYTYIQVNIYTTESDKKKHSNFIEDIYKRYDALTNSFKPLEDSSEFLENIYGINQNIGQTLEIDKALYEVLEFSLQYQEMTHGYFDITLGKASKIWKSLIDNAPKQFEVGAFIYVYSNDNEPINERFQVTSIEAESISVLDKNNQARSFDLNLIVFDYEISSSIYEQTIQQINELNFENNKVTLTIVDNKYFVKVEGKDAQLDLGAISKGYATELVKRYLIDHGVSYFSISVGSSTIALGKNINRPDENNHFNIGLMDPKKTKSLFRQAYGVIKLKDKVVTTSGNFEQYAVYEGRKYHHIISPITKMPTQFYETVTIVGDDAGLLDALSTALFVMDNETFLNFYEEYKEQLSIEIVRYNESNEIDTFLDTLIFEENE